MFIKKFPHFVQVENSDCGATCLKIIMKYYGKDCDISYLRELTQVTRSGISLFDIKNAAEKLNFTTRPLKTDLHGLKELIHLPCILHWEREHFVVLYKIKNKKYYISDPAFGKVILKESEFTKLWNNSCEIEGILIEIKPTETFYKNSFPKNKNNFKSLKSFLFNIIDNQQYKILWLFLLVGISTFIAYILPQTIQNTFDKGVKLKDNNILWGIFGFQLLLFLSQTIVNIIQNFIGVHFSTQVSIKMLTNLLLKIIKLPIHFFENRQYSDILQKIDEQSKIEQLITKHLISSIFSIFLFIALCFRLIFYNVYLGLGFILFISLSIFWLFLFYNKRKILDYFSHRLMSDNKNNLIEMITGMVSVKISNAQNYKISEWKIIQEKIYKLRIRSLVLENYQSYSMTILKQLFTIATNFLCALWVIEGKMSIGEMLSVGYITGLISQPIENIIFFIRSFQDSKIVYNRTQEIYKNKDENINLIKDFITHSDNIILNNLNYKYYGGGQPYVLKNINVIIPKGKITAIVGESGSGKTTLLKLLLGFYSNYEGEIILGNNEFKSLDKDYWRKNCGVVMQDGYIFSGTIAENIAMKQEFDIDKLNYSCKIACLLDYISELPKGYFTKIGNTGTDLSGGQKQRILIARAVYNSPNFLFFDEATSSLDANNEKTIMNNLQNLFSGKTVVIIAHRLSTVKNSDQIIVLKKGHIIESGNHSTLVNNKNIYYDLVKNQLELSK